MYSDLGSGSTYAEAAGTSKFKASKLSYLTRTRDVCTPMLNAV